MALKTVRLELARTREHPEGNSNMGYEIVIPVDDAGHLNVEEWRKNKKACTVHRFWQNEDDKMGNLIHTRHRTWAISYEPGEEDDSPFFHLESHLLKEGDYLSITEEDGTRLPFKIVSVR